MHKKYTDEELSRAMLIITDQNMSPAQVAIQTGIHLRTIQRYKSKYVDNKQIPKQKPKEDDVVVYKDTTLPDTELPRNVDATLTRRAKFMDDVFNLKQLIVDRLEAIVKKSQNIDTLQRTLKTLTELEKETKPDDPVPGITGGNVNIFTYLNQQLEKDGYKGQPLTDADIIEGDD